MTSLIVDFLLDRLLQLLRMLEQILEQADRLGIIVSVGQALITREAEVEGFPHGHGAVLVEEGGLFLFADDAEHRAGAPVRQVVVAALELDGAGWPPC